MELRPVTSSMIAAIGYDPETMTLRVKFADRARRDGEIAGAVCDYPDCDEADYESLLAAVESGRSIGASFNLLFRHRKYSVVTENDADGKEAA